ncbi:MAG: AIM24 family protein, partial [Planctomycetota bacterium]
EPGENLLVSTGNLAAFSKSCDYRIRGVGGCLKMFFGGEGFFMTELSGPGRVLVQTLKRGVGKAEE